MKKRFGCLIVLLAVLVCAAAAADVALDSAHFPDEIFREAVRPFDLNGNGKLETREIEQAQVLNCPGAGISSIDGIQYLTALVEVTLYDNQIETADFSKNLQLTNITIYSNQLTKLNVSKNTALLGLGCSNNKLTSLTLPKAPNLSWLDVTTNSIKKLDVTNTPLLEEAVASVAPTDYIYWDGGYSINWIAGDIFLAVDKNVTVVSGGNSIVEPTDVTEFKYNGIVYSLNKKKKTAAVSGVTDRKSTELSVEDAVKVFDITYKVTAINDSAFQGLKKLKKLTIGKKVKTLGRNAVASCPKLTTVSGGTAVTNLGDSAFSGCKVLKSFPALKKLQSIGPNAFKGCAKLPEFTLGSAVRSIGTNAFWNCKMLKAIKVETTRLTAKNIGDNAFKNVNKKAVFTCPKAKLNTYKTLFIRKGAAKTCQFK